MYNTSDMIPTNIMFERFSIKVLKLAKKTEVIPRRDGRANYSWMRVDRTAFANVRSKLFRKK
jgi:hypothetical protein